MAESVSGYIVFLGFRGSVVRRVSLFFFSFVLPGPPPFTFLSFGGVCVCA